MWPIKKIRLWPSWLMYQVSYFLVRPYFNNTCIEFIDDLIGDNTYALDGAWQRKFDNLNERIRKMAKTQADLEVVVAQVKAAQSALQEALSNQAARLQTVIDQINNPAPTDEAAVVKDLETVRDSMTAMATALNAEIPDAPGGAGQNPPADVPPTA